MKHRLLLIAITLLAVILVLSLAACGDNETTTTTSGSDTTAPESTTAAVTTDPGPSKEELRAMEMVDAIYQNYAVSGSAKEIVGGATVNYINLKEWHNQTQSGYLWSNFCGVGMQYYLCKLENTKENKDTFRKMIDNFKFFRQYNPKQNAAEDSVKYHSGRGTRPGMGTGECFFDDNIWVARNFLRAYEILGDEWFLEEAIRVNNWVISGWNDKLGGIVWCESALKDTATEQELERGLSANACGIIVNAMLAELVEDPEDKAFHKAWAEKFYTFCKQMQNTPISHDYWNGIHTVIVNGERQNGSINKVHYSYNSGSMILANLALYDIETDTDKKAAYLEDAVETAKSAKKTFCKIDGTGKRYYIHDPWFAAILCESYYELGAYDKELADSLMASFDTNVTMAYKNRDTVTGLFPYQSTKPFTWDNNASYVIHQVGVAQQAVLVALYNQEMK